MPKGATFHGVWQSPQYGNMHVCQSGKAIVGSYAKHEREGRIQGSVAGNSMRFHWEDRRELVSGKPTVSRGRGYFQISIGEDGDQYLKGEWGFDDADHGGGPWNAVKLRRSVPDRCVGKSRSQVEPEVDETPWGDDDDSDTDADAAAP